MDRSNPSYLPDPNQILQSQLSAYGYQDSVGTGLSSSQYAQSLPPIPPSISHPQPVYHLNQPAHSYHNPALHQIAIPPLYNPNIYRLRPDAPDLITIDNHSTDYNKGINSRNIDDYRGEDLTKGSSSQNKEEKVSSKEPNIYHQRKNETASPKAKDKHNLKPDEQQEDVKQDISLAVDPNKNLFLDETTGQCCEMTQTQVDAAAATDEEPSDKPVLHFSDFDDECDKESVEKDIGQSSKDEKESKEKTGAGADDPVVTAIIENLVLQSKQVPVFEEKVGKRKSKPHKIVKQETVTKGRGYDQILEMCNMNFPSNIQLIQEIINLSHDFSTENGENIENICNKLMSELLHLNHTISQLCKTSLESEKLKSDSNFSTPFGTLLNAWKLNMLKKKKSGTLSKEDEEMLKMESLNSNSDWNDSVPTSGVDFNFTPDIGFGKSGKSKKRQKGKPKIIQEPRDDDYMPSAEKRNRSRKNSMNIEDASDTKRSLRNRSSSSSTKVYQDDEDSDDPPDTVPEISDSEEETPEVDQAVNITKVQATHPEAEQHKCPICNLPFKSVRSVALHKRQKHVALTIIKNPCHLCTLSFDTLAELEKHVLTHDATEKVDLTVNSLTTYECKLCGATFHGQLKYDLHMRYHTNRRSHKCSVCSKMFATKFLLVRHKNIAHKESMAFPCSECDKCFKTETPLKYHLMRHKGQLPFPCRYCENQYPNVSSRNNHELTHSEERRFSCDMCDKKFKTQHSLKKHQLLHSGEKSFQCDFCGQQFRQKSTLTSHRRTHTGEKPYICDVCGKAFTQSSILNMHKRVHTGYKPHQCTYCDSAFSCGASLRKHLTIHTGEKNFMCKVCGRRFARAQGLKHHERSHTGVKPYECKECGKRFTCPKHVKRHKLMHTGEFPFTCNVCGKLFRQEYNMKVHMRVHTGDKPFQCLNCGRCFAYNQSLQMHSSHCVKQVGFLGYDIQLQPVNEIQ